MKFSDRIKEAKKYFNRVIAKRDATKAAERDKAAKRKALKTDLYRKTYAA